MTKGEIIESLRRHEARGQREAMRCWGPLVWDLVCRMGLHGEDAEDAYHDAWTEALTHINRYDETRADITVWLRGIAYKVAVTHWRQLPQTTTVHLDDAQWNKLSDDEAQERLGRTDPQTVELIAEAMRRLTPEEKTLVTLFYYDDLSTTQIADITHTIPTTVASRLCRTRKKLYAIIKSLEHEK